LRVQAALSERRSNVQEETVFGEEEGDRPGGEMGTGDKGPGTAYI